MATQTLNLSTISNAKGSATYGFSYSTSYTSYFSSGLVPTNLGTNNSYSYAILTFTAPANNTTMTVSVYQGSEKNYDYGLVSDIDTYLSYDYNADSSYKYNAKGLSGSATITYTGISAGSHFITVKYRKDTSQSTSPDLFAITSIVLTYTSGYTISYVCNNNGISSISSLSNQSSLPNPLPTPTFNSYHIFRSWYTDSSFTSKAVAGSSISSDTTLYAKWFSYVGEYVKGSNGEYYISGGSHRGS